MVFSIRHAEPNDHAAIAPLLEAWWGWPMGPMLPRLFFVHFRPTSFVAESDGQLAGFLCGFRSQTYAEQAYVHFIGVSPAGRRLGVGRALYTRFFETVAPLGCTELRALTSPRNQRSVAFHRSLGFEVLPGAAEHDGVPFTPDYDGPGEARVLFRKRL